MKNAFDLIIFGGTGDLSMRKIVPSIYRSFQQGDIPNDSRILMCCRKQTDFDNMLKTIETKLKLYLKDGEFTQDKWHSFSMLLTPVQLDVIKFDEKWDIFGQLFDGFTDRIRVFYLAILPSIYGECCENLHKKDLITRVTRVVVEKPIGYDLVSAEAINEKIAKHFVEDQIFRIDHYLGKETVQNLLTLRFGNFLFENLWDSKSIDHIQISITEQVGLEGRAGFYDEIGAMRDMVQNHLLQLLCLIAIDSPNQLSSDALRIEKVKVLQALKPLINGDIEKNTVRGQYVSGLIDGQKVPGYLDELGNYESSTETYAALKVYIENWRWTGVPFYLRTGKRLKKRSAEIIIQFKDVTHNVYDFNANKLKPNQLILKLQPDEKIQMRLMANDVAGGTTRLQPILLNLDFGKEQDAPQATSYQRLIMDAVRGNSTLFIHREEVTAAWQWVDPIVESWKNSDISPELYTAGSWGPKKADELFEKPHQKWHENQ